MHLGRSESPAPRSRRLTKRAARRTGPQPGSRLRNATNVVPHHRSGSQPRRTLATADDMEATSDALPRDVQRQVIDPLMVVWIDRPVRGANV